MNHPGFIAFSAKPIAKEETEAGKNEETAAENEKTETESENNN